MLQDVVTYEIDLRIDPKLTRTPVLFFSLVAAAFPNQSIADAFPKELTELRITRYASANGALQSWRNQTDSGTRSHLERDTEPAVDVMHDWVNNTGDAIDLKMGLEDEVVKILKERFPTASAQNVILSNGELALQISAKSALPTKMLGASDLAPGQQWKAPRPKRRNSLSSELKAWF